MKVKIFYISLIITSLFHAQSNAQKTTDLLKVYYHLEDATAEAEKVEILDLSSQKLNFDTVDLSQFLNLKYLTIIHNGKQSLPVGIEKLFYLKSLDISASQLSSISIEFFRLKVLEELHLNNDRILNIDSSLSIISKMPSLKRLYLDSIIDMEASLDQSPIYNIEYLSLRNDNLNNLPQFIKRFKNLKVLDLSGNKISSIEKDFFVDQHIEELSLGLSENFNLEEGFNTLKTFSDLKILHFDNTDIVKFPDDLSSVKNIEYLSLSNDHLKEFPLGLTSIQSLKVLDLSGNDFEKLPEEFDKLQNLEELYLSNDLNLDIKASFDVLSKLPKLRILHLDNITTNKLPSNFKKMSHLEAVYLLDGQFFMLPNEKHSLKNLSRVDLRNNSIPVNGNNHNGFGLRLRW